MNENTKILVIDDEPGMRDMLSAGLQPEGYSVLKAGSGEEGIQILKQEKIHLVITDLHMPGMDGLAVVEEAKKVAPEVEFIMMSGNGTIETAVQAMKKGSFDFVQKPFNLHELLLLVKNALEKSELKALVAVHDASRVVFSSMKLDILIPRIVHLAAKILKADDVSIMLLDEEGKLVLSGLHGPDGQKKISLEIGQRVAGKMSGCKESIIIVGPLEKDPRFSDIPSLREIKSSIVCPLIIEEEFLGVLNANRTIQNEPFSGIDARNATIFGSQIAQAVKNASLYQQLETAQHRLVQSEKLAGIGQLAAGVAHELNNPLTGILGLSELMLENDNLTGQEREDLQTICFQSQRCRTIIQNLLQFSRRGEEKMEVLDILPLLELTLKLVHHDFEMAGIKVCTQLGSKIPSIVGNTNQLQQVFLNLLTNARHALEGKKSGEITVTAEQIQDKVHIRFADNGCGIDAPIIGKIFDPFFTTKPIGKGTGLGLSVSYGIINQHKGLMRVESTKGIGSTFVIELPVAMAQAA